MHKILVIDIETTGFQKQGGSIVEVGMVELDLATGDTAIVFDSLCRESILSERHFEEPLGWIFKNSTLKAEEVLAAPGLDALLPEIQEIVNAILQEQRLITGPSILTSSRVAVSALVSSSLAR